MAQFSIIEKCIILFQLQYDRSHAVYVFKILPLHQMSYKNNNFCLSNINIEQNLIIL